MSMLQRATQYTPFQFIRKAPRVLFRQVRQLIRTLQNSYVPTLRINQPTKLSRLIRLSASQINSRLVDTLVAYANNLTENRIDVLGSGWVSLDYGIQRAGFSGTIFPVDPELDGTADVWRVNGPNRPLAESVAGNIDKGYRPIDWQVDLKSGYRWSVRDRSHDTLVGIPEGADIKIPWELGRLNHLPILSLAFVVADESGDTGAANKYLYTFRNQVLDFIANNPPEFGVNWCTATLAGVRISNLLVAYDMFVSAGAEFDPAFKRIFSSSVWSHAQFIASNLERWDLGQRNNHYLANLCGLAFCVAYLPVGRKTNRWHKFLTKELDREALTQFNNDGSCFEGSTAYHAFSLELLTWAAAAVTTRARRTVAEQHIVQGRYFESRFYARLTDAAKFLADVTMNSGNIVQIGDNDSGRLLRIAPDVRIASRYHALRTQIHLIDSWDAIEGEDILDTNELNYSEVLRTTNAFLNTNGSDGSILSDLVVAALSLEEPQWMFSREKLYRKIALQQTDTVRFDSATSLHLPLDGVGEEFEVIHYPDFGLIVFRSDRLYLSFVCKTKALRTNVGHPHDDQLSLTIELDGAELVSDPGTYVYMASLARRNQFRSAEFHFCPQIENRTSTPLNLFESPSLSLATLEYLDAGTVRASVQFGNTVVRRTIQISNTGIDISDEATGGKLRDLSELLQEHRSRPVSNGYGKLRLPHPWPEKAQEPIWIT